MPAPAKQLLRRQSVPACHRGNRVAAGLDLRDHPRLVRVAPCPTAPRTGEFLQPTSRLGESTIHYVHFKPSGSKEPQRRRSGHQPEGGEGTTLTVERLWRSVKYEEVYLRAYGSVRDARTSIGRYLTFYNSRRPHSSLDRKTPDQAYFNQPLLAAA